MSRPTAIITGAARRLGKAITLKLFERGCNIVLHYGDSAQAAAQLSDHLNAKRPNACIAVSCDLASNKDWLKLIECAKSQFNRIDVLINNASVFYPRALSELTESEMDSTFKVNWQTPVELAKAAYPELAKNQGSIVNLIDIYARAGLKNHTAYVAAKAALLEATKQQALGFAPSVRVNSVSPGAILWPDQATADEIGSTETQKRKQILEDSALKRLGSPKDIAETVAFLALEARYITGENINVDGGRNLYI